MNFVNTYGNSDDGNSAENVFFLLYKDENMFLQDIKIQGPLTAKKDIHIYLYIFTNNLK